jgi:hypothetical protein
MSFLCSMLSIIIYLFVRFLLAIELADEEKIPDIWQKKVVLLKNNTMFLNRLCPR